jgi:signal peptidase I
VLYLVLIGLVIVFAYQQGYKANEPNDPYAWLVGFNGQLPDRINSSDIQFDKTGIHINGKFILSEYADTDSMIPIFDEGSNGISIQYTKDIQLQVGDIVTFTHKGSNIAHRVVFIGRDDWGTYYVVKGDNNDSPDSMKLRDHEIQRVLVGVIW